jgi:predicted small secreted protein
MKTKLILLPLLLGLALTFFSGCRTAHGFGEDMENAGEKIQDQTQ